jgi:hypothetical protein
MELHNGLVVLREKVQHYLDTGEIPKHFHDTFGICGNGGCYPTPTQYHLMAQWSEAQGINGGGEYPVDGDFHNYYERRFARWDQSTKWGRDRLALLDWLILETAKLGI